MPATQRESERNICVGDAGDAVGAAQRSSIVARSLKRSCPGSHESNWGGDRYGNVRIPQRQAALPSVHGVSRASGSPIARPPSSLMIALDHFSTPATAGACLGLIRLGVA